MRTLFKGLFIAISFFVLWFFLAQFDFRTFFKIDETKNLTENRIGDLIWNQISSNEDFVYNTSIVKTLDKLIAPICKKNNIARDSLKIHIIEKDEVNAFALPNNHLVVYTGLILECKNQEALQGVLAHEIAHIENNHVMKKLSKEIGLSLLLSATTGGQNNHIISEITKVLSSSAYDRKLEKEADMASVEYLMNSNINPEYFADFMFELAQQNQSPNQLSWIATHPEPEDRANYILGYLKGKKYKKEATISYQNWEIFKKQIRDNLN
jgi:beta-barrel assembly-enhancing protease